MHSPSPRSSDTEAEIRSLYDALDERDRYITSLEREVDRNVTARNTELEVCKDELTQSKDKVSELQIQLKQLRGDNDDLLEEKSKLEKQLRLLDQESLLGKNKSTENVTITRLQRDMHRLELENQRLRASVIEFEQNEDILVHEIDTLVSEKSKFQAKSESLSAKVDSLSSENDELSQMLAEMKQDNDNLRAKVDASNTSLKECKEKEAAAMQKLSKLEIDLENERSNDHHVELVALKEELECLQASYNLCVTDKHAAEQDLDDAVKAIHHIKSNEKEAIAAAVRNERADAVKAQLTIEGLHKTESKLRQECKDVEAKLEATQQKLRRAKEKNEQYEKDHGLADAIRYSTKLESDIRRRDFDINKLKQNVEEQKEQCQFLRKACDILKEKTNLGPEFSFDEEEIQNALKCEENVLKAENAELSRQLQCLEGERNELLSQLRHRAVEIGEKGATFLGLDAVQLDQVIDFANNLRKGTVTLPLNDRSADLLSQLSKIKAERDVDKVTIERLERELFALSETRKDPIDEGEKKILKHSIDVLKAEISSLKNDKSSNLSPMMRNRAKEILGEELVAMPAAAEVQFMCLMKEYDSLSSKRAIEEHNPFLELNPTNLDPSSDTPNKELFRQLLFAGEENRMLKNKLRQSEADANAMRAVLETEKCRFVSGDVDNEFGGDSGSKCNFNEVHLEMKQMMIALESNLDPLIAYSRDLVGLRKSVANSTRLTTQLTALQSVLQKKNSIIQDMKNKLARAKQTQQTLTRELSLGRDVDTSTSTNSLDRSIRRASENMLSYSGSSDAAKLLFDKDKIISSLRSKLVESEKSQEGLLQETQRMGQDITTLVARLEEAEGIACEVEVYRSTSIELQSAIEDGKKDMKCLKDKLRALSKASKDKEAKIDELKESLIRSKRVLSVQRQGRSRSEHNVKVCTETIASLHQQIEKLETEAATAREEKVNANKRVRRLSSMLRSTNGDDNKVIDKSAEGNQTEEKMQQRIDVQDKTIAGLASQNSKLRTQLAQAKKTIKDADKEEDCSRCNELETKMKQLDQSLSKEKKDLSTTRSKLERSKKKILSLEQQVSHLQVEIETREAAANDEGMTDSLQEEICALREKNQSLLLAMKENNFDNLKQLKAENFSLKKENERLLRVDHLSLFETIEELKIRYNEAVRQLNQLSQR